MVIEVRVASSAGVVKSFLDSQHHHKETPSIEPINDVPAKFAQTAALARATESI
jgi:hypothetical protein